MTKRVTPSPEDIAKKVINRTEKKLLKKITNQERERYKKRKHLVKTLEDTNNSKLIAFATVGETGFWKLIGRSAIYFAYHEAPRLKIEVSIAKDTDFFDKDKNGFVAIRDIEKFKKQIEYLGGRETNEIDDKYIRVFDMGVNFSEADLKNMLRREEMLVEQINRALLPEVSDPELYKTLRIMLNTILNSQKTTDESIRQFTYDAVVNPARLAISHYIWMCRNSSNISTAKQKIVTDLEMVSAGMKTIQNAGLWKLRPIHEISLLAERAEVLARKLGNKGNGNNAN